MVNNVDGITYEVLTTPTMDFALAAQDIGYAAWSERFTRRSDEEIRMMFDPDEPGHTANAERLLGRMQEKAAAGRFAGALALYGSRPVGYAWAGEDRAVSPQQPDPYKEEKPFVWLAHANVIPEFQGTGIGTETVGKVLGHFEDDQKPTTYVFDENQPTLDWMKRLGFRADPPAWRLKYDYFGEQNAAVWQWRLEAPSVRHVLDTIAERTRQHASANSDDADGLVMTAAAARIIGRHWDEARRRGESVTPEEAFWLGVRACAEACRPAVSLAAGTAPAYEPEERPEQRRGSDNP